MYLHVGVSEREKGVRGSSSKLALVDGVFIVDGQRLERVDGNDLGT